MPEWMIVTWFILSCAAAVIGTIAFWVIWSEEHSANEKRVVKDKFGALKPGAAAVVWVFMVAGVFFWPLALAGLLVYCLGHIVTGIPSALQFLIGSAHDIKISR